MTTMTTDVTDVTVRLDRLKQQIETGKAEKVRAQTNLETYTKQLDDVKAEIESMGVEPSVDALGAEIARLDAEILESLNKAEGLLGVGVEVTRAVR